MWADVHRRRRALVPTGSARARVFVFRPIDFVWLIGAPLMAAGCSQPVATNAQARGEALFESRALSPSRLNFFTCATCHQAQVDPDDPYVRPGAALAGATDRPSFWGGQENDLLRAINACRKQFMFASAPLAAADPDAEALYAYLLTLEPGDSAPAPFTIVRSVLDLPRGESQGGARVFARTCALCHGSMHEGQGRLDERVPVLPEQTLAEHAEYGKRSQRLIFIEKIRHGGFLDYGGEMPPYARETLADSEVSDLLEAMQVTGEE